MPSRSAEIDDVLSSIRKIIDERGPARRAEPFGPDRPKQVKPPALVLSSDHLVSLPLIQPEMAAPAPEAEVPPEQGVEDDAVGAAEPAEQGVEQAETSPSVGAAVSEEVADEEASDPPEPEAEAPVDDGDAAFFGPERDRWVHRSSSDESTPTLALNRIATAAQRAALKFGTRSAANADKPVSALQEQPKADAPAPADNLFAPSIDLPPVPAGAAQTPSDDDAKDDALAEHLADVVRDQIAESLPQQIKALAPHLLDEDILRPVVAEMIRKELSGALGEKITQGVRKLVRQELNRAITLRRLE